MAVLNTLYFFGVLQLALNAHKLIFSSSSRKANSLVKLYHCTTIIIALFLRKVAGSALVLSTVGRPFV